MDTITNQCPVCHGQMTAEQDFCTNCGWMRVIYPEVVPESIRKMEEQRLAQMQEMFKQRLEAERRQTADNKTLNDEIDRQKRLVEESQEKNKELSDNNDKLFDELFTTKGELTTAKTERDAAKKELGTITTERDAARNELGTAKGQLSTTKKERDAARDERDAANKKLADTQRQLKTEQEAHAATKKELADLRAKANATPHSTTPPHTTTPPNKPTPSVQPTPTPKKGPKKGDVLFMANGKTVRLPFYEGTNVFAAPSGMNCGVSGDLFRVRVEAGNTGARIYDVCGQTRRANGQSLGFNGKEIYSGDVFAVGSMKVAFEMEEIDLDSLLL